MLIEVPEGGSFKELSKLKGYKEIGDKINKVIRKMADENDLLDVITVADFNDRIRYFIIRNIRYVSF